MTSPAEPHTRSYSHNGGSINDILDRAVIAELCKGWPLYRDNSEWANYRSIFAKEAWVWTSES